MYGKTTDGSAEVVEVNVVKVNDVKRHGVSLRKENQRIAKTVWLNEWYHLYQEGQMVEDIAEIIVAILMEEDEIAKNVDLSIYEHIYDYESIKDCLTLKLIEMESNQQFLQGKVYVPFLEFAVVFGIQNKCDDMSLNMDVTEELLKHWGMDKEELFAQVLENQQKKSPVVIKNLSALINLSMFDTDNSANLYVMTNEEKINGAATILYPDVLKEFAEEKGVDEVYMLPSSIHEWLLVPDKEAEANLKRQIEGNDKRGKQRVCCRKRDFKQ